MYIQPNSIAVLLTGVPLDETYDHTIKFASETAQRNYFLSKELMRVHPQTYQRHSENVIRVEALADNLYHVNYLMFQNTSFGNKWFYAFVKRVEYVNNKTTELVYEIDIFQTWLFEMNVGQCFVEREHIVNDEIGANLLDEGLQLGDHEINYTRLLTRYPQATNLSDKFYGLVVVTNPAPASHHLHGLWGLGASNNVLVGGAYFFYYNLLTEDDNFTAFLGELEQLPTGAEQVIAFTLIPKGVIDNYNSSDNPNDDYVYLTRAIPTLSYQPKNKKLYQYPYCFVEVSDNSGNSNVYKYEYFDKEKVAEEAQVQEPVYIGFRCGATISPQPEMNLTPVGYNCYNSVNDTDSEMDAMMISTCLPLVPFTTDSYKIWLAQNSTWVNGHRVEGSEIVSPQMISSALSQAVIGTGVGLATGNAVGAGIGAVTGATNFATKVAERLSEREKAKLLPDKYNAGTGNTPLQFNRTGFTLYCKSIREPMMRRIDSYFEMYGYRTDELKVPNMDSRPHWNFVKTAWANISGNIPADDLENLKRIFNNGITFWKNPSEVGNYTLNNH